MSASAGMVVIGHGIDAIEVARIQRMLVEHAMEAGVHGMQGWTLQTDETEARRRVCGDAWAAMVAPDADLAAAVGQFKRVTGGLGKALERRRDRERVQAADFQAARRHAEQALAELQAPDMQAALATVEANFNKEARGPAQQLLAATREGGVPDRLLVNAVDRLLDMQNMRDSVPKAAAKAGAAGGGAAGWPGSKRAPWPLSSG